VRIILGSLTAVLIGLALFEVTMQPSGGERLELGIIFMLMATVSGIAAAFLPLLARHSQRLLTTLFALSFVSLVVASLGLLIAANRMFFSSHDLTLVLVVLAFGLVAGVTFAATAARSLTTDLSRMSDTARRVASGQPDARTGVNRADEIGSLARELDELARQLAVAAEERENEDARRREFFAAVSHDLRTPLASMQAATEALSDGVASDPDQYLASLQADITVLHSLVEDLFLLARIQAGDVQLNSQRVDVTELVDETIEIVTPVADRCGVSIVLNADRRVIVDTAPLAVGRVVRNLLDNAVRHAPRGSSVTVHVTDNRGATIVVSDEGSGFDPEFAERAFDSFARSDAARTRESGGAGLGLAIAHDLVGALGGDIWIHPGEGGVVGFSIPAQ